MRQVRFEIIVVTVICVLLQTAVVVAQDPVPPRKPADLAPARPAFSPFPFRLPPIGARALGMGGATLGVGGDAAAVVSNPAGVGGLTSTEVAVQLRSTSHDVTVDDFNAQAAVDLIGDLRTFLVDSGFATSAFTAPSTVTELDGSTADVDFGSVAHPLGPVVVSLYYARAYDFEGESLLAFDDEAYADFYETRKVADILHDHFGLAATYRFGDFGSVGVALRRSRLKVDSVDEYRVDFFNDLEFLDQSPVRDPDQMFAFTDFIVLRETRDEEDTDETVSVGLLLHPHASFSIGLSYNQGGSYRLRGREEEERCVNFELDNDDTMPGPEVVLRCNPNTLEGPDASRIVRTTQEQLDLPDVYGIGLAWRPTTSLTLAADVQQITYGDLEPAVRIDGVTEAVDDEIEIHLGLEYTIQAGASRTPFVMRVGVFNDPDHDGFRQVDSDELHITAGLGAVFWQRLEIDLAGHFSELADEALVSVAYRF